MVLSRLTKITGPGVATDTNWVGNNADFTGITTTATSFNIGVTTIHSTLIESHNIVSTGVITATGGSFSGNVTAVDGTFTGNVSIAGTLTYEDVTNIDSVGIITAPAVDIDDFLDVGSNIKLGNAGVITATSFVGSGAALTGIDATAIKDSGGNVKIQAQASGAVYTGIHTFSSGAEVGSNIKFGNAGVVTATSFTGSGANLTSLPAGQLTGTVADARISTLTASKLSGALPAISGANLTNLDASDLASGTIPDARLPATLPAISGANLTNLDASDLASGTVPTARLGSGTANSSTFLRGDSTFAAVTSTTINNNADNRIITGTGSANVLNAESNVHIDGSGRLLVGTSTNNAHANADNAVISGTGNIGLSIMSTDSGRSSIYFGDSSSSPGSYAGYIDFIHSSNSFNIGRGNDNSLTIDSNGYLGINQTPYARLDVKQDNAVAYNNTAQSITYNAARFLNTSGHQSGGTYTGFQFNLTGNGQNRICSIGAISEASNSKNSSLVFHTDDNGNRTEKLRINSLGQISIKGTTTAFDTTGDLDSLQLYYEIDSGQASIGPYSSGGTTHLSFYTNAGGAASTEKLRITGSGEVYFYGNQTSAPEGDFGFRWDRNQPVNLQITNTNNTSVNAGAKITLKSNIGTFAGTYYNNGGFYLINSANGYFNYYSNSTLRVNINTNGDVFFNPDDANGIPSSNGALGKRFGIKSTANNVILGETTQSGTNYGLHIESRQTGRGGNARFAQIGLRNDSSGGGEITFQTAASGADVTERLRIHASGNTQIYGGDLLLGPDSVSQMEATIRAWGCSLWFTTIDPNYYHDSGGEFRQFYNKGSFRGDNYLTAYNCPIQTGVGPQNRNFWRGANGDTRAEGSLDIGVGYRGAWFFIGQMSCASIPYQGNGRYLFDRGSTRCSVSFDSFGNNIESGELSFHCGSSAGYNSGNSSIGGRLGSSSSDSTLRMYCIGVNMENYNAPNSKRAGNHIGISVINDDGTDYGSSRLSENLINNSTTGGTNSASGEFNWGNRHSNDRGGTTTFRHSQLLYFDDVQLNSAQWDYLEHYFKVMYG